MHPPVAHQPLWNLGCNFEIRPRFVFSFFVSLEEVGLNDVCSSTVPIDSLAAFCVFKLLVLFK